MNYANPSNVPVSACAGNRGMCPLCSAMTGHLTECHFPLDCKTAACNHLSRYDPLEQEELGRLAELAVTHLQRLAEKDCVDCGGTGAVEVFETFPVPEAFRHLADDEWTVTTSAVCRCVAVRAFAQG